MANITADNPTTQAYYDYLEKLRKSGKTNMFGATPYLANKFSLDTDEARKILTDWMGAHK